MKRVYLIRHAKSSWDHPSVNDHDRTLNQRGNTDAPNMAMVLLAKYDKPDFMVTSTAKRAFETALHFAAKFEISGTEIQKDKSLYLCDIEDIMNAITSVNKKYNSAMFFGHNPGITYFANVVCDANIMNVPTCGILVLDINSESWENADASLIQLVDFLSPKGEND